METDWHHREPKDVRVLVVGATGYIGKFVTKELVKRGYQTVALARPASGIKGKSTPDDIRKARTLQAYAQVNAIYASEFSQAAHKRGFCLHACLKLGLQHMHHVSKC